MFLLLTALTAAGAEGGCTYQDTVQIFAGRPSREGVGLYGQSAFEAKQTHEGIVLLHSDEQLGVLTENGFDGRTGVLWPQDAIITALAEHGLPAASVVSSACDERPLTRALVLAFPDGDPPKVHTLLVRRDGDAFQVLSKRGQVLGDTHAHAQGSWKLTGEKLAAWITLSSLWRPPKHDELH